MVINQLLIHLVFLTSITHQDYLPNHIRSHEITHEMNRRNSHSVIHYLDKYFKNTSNLIQ